ncbi:MAG: dienelactone hydrolase family protein [Betaproteobacteria bacterium]
MTASSGGFAAAAVPSSATAIVTDATGLLAGDVMIAAGDRDIPAYCAMPVNGASLPVVLVVQEIFGVHEHIRDVCRRFAKAGYLAIAPELYVRQGDASAIADIARLIDEIVSKVPDRQVLSDLDAAARWAITHGGHADKMAVSGFCWGGRIVWMYAAHNPALKAGVAWYGGLIRPANAMTPTHPIDIAATLTVPVLGLYGGADTGIPLEAVEKMQSALRAAGSASSIHVYADTPHAFHADYRPSFRKEAAEDGWRRCLAWLRNHGVA